MEIFVCKVCGFVSFGSAPDKCPVCGAPKQAFQSTPDAIKKPADLKNLTDGDKKHIPVIKINKTCGLVGPGCTDVNIKVGEVIHVMEAKHYIMYIDVYLDNNFIHSPLENPALKSGDESGFSIRSSETTDFSPWSFICRCHFTPEKLNPVLGLHLKADSGKLLVLENCNVHGRWIAEAVI